MVAQQTVQLWNNRKKNNLNKNLITLNTKGKLSHSHTASNFGLHINTTEQRCIQLI